MRGLTRPLAGRIENNNDNNNDDKDNHNNNHNNNNHNNNDYYNERCDFLANLAAKNSNLLEDKGYTLN